MVLIMFLSELANCLILFAALWPGVLPLVTCCFPPCIRHCGTSLALSEFRANLEFTSRRYLSAVLWHLWRSQFGRLQGLAKIYITFFLVEIMLSYCTNVSVCCHYYSVRDRTGVKEKNGFVYMLQLCEITGNICIQKNYRFHNLRNSQYFLIFIVCYTLHCILY